MSDTRQTAQPIAKIVKRKLSDEVFERLHQMIRDGQLQPGALMPPERELMLSFGVGRPAIREALQSLNNMGLITISHGERARVNALTARSVFKQVDTSAKTLLSASPDTLAHLKEARAFFELAMVRVAAERAGATDIAQLKAILERQRSKLDDPAGFIQADMDFHNQLAAITGNSIYEAVSESMLNWLKAYHTDALIWSGNEHLTLAEHQRVIECIERGDGPAAEAAMKGHLDRSGEFYQHH